MNLDLPDEYERFRSEVRRFVQAEWLSDEAQSLSNEKRTLRVRERGIAAGLVLRNVPRAYGGAGAEPDSVKLFVIEDEFRRARVTTTPHDVVLGEKLVVPTLLEHGSEWQKAHFIPRSLTGDLVWAQGYSEPGAGSDLASVSTRAHLEGDEWVVNGHKIWTTNAATGNYLFALVRSEPDQPRHRGLSYLLIDMKSPGVDARPLRIATGAEHFGEVHLDDVRVPACNLVGARGEGWQVANSTLSFERNMVGSANELYDTYTSLIELAARSPWRARFRLQDPAIQDRLLEIEGLVQSHRLSSYRQLSRIARGESAGALSMFNKLSSTSISERMAMLANEIMGEDALLDPPPDDNPRGDLHAAWRKQFYWAIANSIAGGSSNIQRNIIAERALGLPRDARDRR